MPLVSPHLPVSALPPAKRMEAVDALRGIAMLWMTVFHFCFDLSHFGYWAQDFRSDPVWTVQRTLIVSLFLICAGMGQALASANGLGWARFSRRWLQVVGAALLVTAGSAIMFPRTFIYFGVLHGMAVMLLVARLSAPAGRWLWPAGVVALALPSVAGWALSGPLAGAADVFNSRALNWLGLVTRKPFTEDYVPVLPWLGVMWWGVASGQWLLRHRPHWLGMPLPRSMGWLPALGRHSLSYYLLHQPVMICAIMAWAALAA
ncbi:MAG: DUF1624 domain-containing protein [Comamonadaceae bacterium]|nr:MAG: DUF1624 domain-containing protein [Comamonadaceae bacterium]